jgi:hypothetical protein
MGDLFKKLLDFKNRAIKWWGKLRPKQKSSALVAGGILGLSFLVGGVFIQAAVGAAVTVGCLGWATYDSPWVSKLMNRHGKVVDITLTILGIVAGPGGGITAVLFGCMLGGFFTVLRTMIWEPEEQPKAAEVVA